MFAPLVVLALASPAFGQSRPWALGFADAPRIPLVGDVNGDGDSDIVAVFPTGDAIIDVSLTIDGQKAGGGFQAATRWGKDCQAVAIGEIDNQPGADVVGIFGGKNLRLAGAFKDGHFADTPQWAVLPKALDHPALASLNHGKSILAYSTKSGAAYEVDSTSKAVKSCHVPGGCVWVGDPGTNIPDRFLLRARGISQEEGALVAQTAGGDLIWLDRTTLKKSGTLGKEPKDCRPAAGGGIVAYRNHVWTPQGESMLPKDALPEDPSVLQIGTLGGEPAIFEFRYGKEVHTGNAIRVWASEACAKLKDSSGDGLLDDWKLNGYRGLDLKALGCTPGHADVVCLISRYDDVKEDFLKSEIQRVVKLYGDLPCKNPDGTTGVRVHPVYLPPVTGADKNSPWWVNRDKFRPEKWRGIVHWMQVTPGGGGQADELGDGGGCGEGALWAVFAHEFGHQLSLNHEGFWPNGACPIYTSLMNYNYSYSFEDSGDKIHFSDGSLSKLVLRETDLDETLPFPYEKVKFLEMGPYHYRLKKNGDTTLIDWNWNGVFGEKHVRANINYAYSINGGVRENVDKTKTAPWLFTHGGRAFVLYGNDDRPSDPATDPTLSKDRPGRLLLRPLAKPHVWGPAWTVESGGLIGDPVAASWAGKVYAFYPTVAGIVLRRIAIGKDGPSMSAPEVVSNDAGKAPTVGVYAGRLYLFLSDPASQDVTYIAYDRSGKSVAARPFPFKSANPIGICTDTVTGEAVIGMAQDQGVDKPNRWQIRRFHVDDAGKFVGRPAPEWIEGKDGSSRGTGRITVLFDHGRDAGPKGRVFFLCKGMTGGKDSPWACAYIAQEIAAKDFHGGWIMKRYYDEWTQTRSAPTATWFGGDLIYAYRWVDGGQGPTDNNLSLAYEGLGISAEPFGDHDDISLIRDFGLQNSLLSLGRP